MVTTYLQKICNFETSQIIQEEKPSGVREEGKLSNRVFTTVKRGQSSIKRIRNVTPKLRKAEFHQYDQ